MTNKVTLNEYEISVSCIMHIMAKTSFEAREKVFDELEGVVDDIEINDCEALYEHDELDLEDTEEAGEEDEQIYSDL